MEARIQKPAANGFIHFLSKGPSSADVDCLFSFCSAIHFAALFLLSKHRFVSFFLPFLVVFLHLHHVFDLQGSHVACFFLLFSVCSLKLKKFFCLPHELFGEPWSLYFLVKKERRGEALDWSLKNNNKKYVLVSELIAMLVGVLTVSLELRVHE